ncbi:PKD domain-containing protein [Robertkochia flava]|uniref:PKD domain-containing protein n=1 Tax=Robertkochia flava TaxID=3447986 RepID=UPI001CCFAC79|nr:hypothetical protein [Robertkochia marina]
MLKKYFTTFLLFLFFSVAAVAQTVGDYRTISSGDWSDTGIWEYFDGTSWITDADAGFPGYPAQNGDANRVEISSGHTILLDVNIGTSPIGTGNSIALLVIGDGVNGSSNETLTFTSDKFLNASSILIRDTGVLQWDSVTNADIRLTVPGDVSLTIENGGNLEGTNGCSSNQRLIVGTKEYSRCSSNGAGGNPSFDEIEGDGGVNPDPCVDDSEVAVPDVATLPTVTGECSVTVSTVPTATDNCEGSITGTTTDPLTYTGEGTYTITWTYDDGNGNVITQNQTVVVDNVTPPTPDVATIPTETGECSVTVTAVPTATDVCGATITGTTTDPLTYTGEGTYTITWTYDDGNGNSSTQDQNVIITDTTAPVADVATLSDIIAQCEVTSLTAPTATDNCGGVVTVTNDASLPITAQGTTVVTWTYTDAQGNFSTQTQNVIITDTTAPVADVATLSDIIAQCEVTSLTAPTATDNCGGVVTVTNDASLPITAQGTTVVTWTYTDAQGNFSTQTQNVIITDTTAPVADVATLSDIIAQCEVTSLTAPTATDNCGGVVTVTNDASLPITAQGTTVVTWTYTDAQGNFSTQTQDVIITDTTPPVPDAASLPDITAE